VALRGVGGPAPARRRYWLEPGNEAEDWTEGWVAGPGVADGFAPHAVLLGGEGGRLQIGDRTGGRVQSAAADPHAHVLEAKEVVGRSARCASVFAGAQKEVESDGEAVRHREAGRGIGCARELNRPMNERNGERLDAHGRGIGLRPCSIEGEEADVDCAKGV
jgi:hypothetical protein